MLHRSSFCQIEVTCIAVFKLGVGDFSGMKNSMPKWRVAMCHRECLHLIKKLHNLLVRVAHLHLQILLTSTFNDRVNQRLTEGIMWWSLRTLCVRAGNHIEASRQRRRCPIAIASRFTKQTAQRFCRVRVPQRLTHIRSFNRVSIQFFVVH